VSDPAYLPDRRPIAARERTLSKRLAGWLARQGFSPNGISIAGMVAGVAAGGALVLTGWPAWRGPAFVAAAVLIQVRLLANMLDGMVALQTGKASPLGELFNEIPDRVSDAAICIGAGYAAGSLPELGYLAACVALFVAYVRAEGKVAGAPQEFCGPMAKPQRMFVLTVAAIWCGLAPPAWQPLIAEPPLGGLMALALAVIVLGGICTAVRRLGRITRALRSRIG
jgi:phosphatidylglycerophosphate synthase